LKRWLVRQFCPTRSRAWPAREAVEASTVAVVGFSIVFVLWSRDVERPVVGCVFDSNHVLAVGVAVNVIGASAGECVASYLAQSDDTLMFNRVFIVTST
jgi:hypothetical protein